MARFKGRASLAELQRQNGEPQLIKREAYLCRLCQKGGRTLSRHDIPPVALPSRSESHLRNYFLALVGSYHDKLARRRSSQSRPFKLRPRLLYSKHANQTSIALAKAKKHAGPVASTLTSKGIPVKLISHTSSRKNAAREDYQQTKGLRSARKMPTGKDSGLKQGDLGPSPKKLSFIKGRRFSGDFASSDNPGKNIQSSVSVKTDIRKVSARNISLIVTERFDSTNRCSAAGISLPLRLRKAEYPGDI